MNFHPLIVHFPIVLLSIYCILEIITSFVYKNHIQLLRAKKRCLWIGTISLFPSFASGESAEDILWKSKLIHLHEEFAEIMRNLFIIISIIYLFNETRYLSPLTQKILWIIGINNLSRIYRYVYKYKILCILAIWGFIMMTWVGALWWAITRGTDHDPIARWIIEQAE